MDWGHFDVIRFNIVEIQQGQLREADWSNLKVPKSFIMETRGS